MKTATPIVACVDAERARFSCERNYERRGTGNDSVTGACGVVNVAAAAAAAGSAVDDDDDDDGAFATRVNDSLAAVVVAVCSISS